MWKTWPSGALRRQTGLPAMVVVSSSKSPFADGWQSRPASAIFAGASARKLVERSSQATVSGWYSER